MNQLEPVAELDGSGNLVAQFVYASKPHVPDYMIRYSGGLPVGTYRLVSDHIGSVRLVVDVDGGGVVQRIDYDEFGNPTLLAGSWDVQPFGFAGGLWDAHAQFVRFGARDLDSNTGRWTTKDPVGFIGGLNLYSYLGGDPLNQTDASGFAVPSPHPTPCLFLRHPPPLQIRHPRRRKKWRLAASI